MTFRFAARCSEGRVSSAWRIWVAGNEAYLQQRSLPGKHQKFSFHSSGICRWARINEGESGRTRKIKEWERPPVPEACENLRSLLIRIMVPTQHLSSHPLTGIEKLNILPAAPAAMALQVDLFISPDTPEIISALCRASETHLVHCERFRDGTYFCLSTGYVSCPPINLNSSSNGMAGQVFGNLVFPDVDRTGSGRPVRMVIMPNDDPPCTIWELGGYEDKEALRLQKTGSPLITQGNWNK